MVSTIQCTYICIINISATARDRWGCFPIYGLFMWLIVHHVLRSGIDVTRFMTSCDSTRDPIKRQYNTYCQWSIMISLSAIVVIFVKFLFVVFGGRKYREVAIISLRLQICRTIYRRSLELELELKLAQRDCIRSDNISVVSRTKRRLSGWQRRTLPGNITVHTIDPSLHIALLEPAASSIDAYSIVVNSWGVRISAMLGSWYVIN